MPGVLGDWDVSPDGKEVAFPDHSSRDARIRLVHLKPGPSGATEHDVVAGGLANLSSLRFSADGKG